VRETEILVEQQPPQGVLVCDHAGLVINKFSSFTGVRGTPARNKRGELCLVPATVELLAPCMRLLPKEHFGLKDPDLRYG